MPYIKQEMRPALDSFIDKLAFQVVTESGLQHTPVSGTLNYCITELLLKTLDSVSYDNLNTLVGVLECAKLELYRRALGVYEDDAIAKNGDTSGYSQVLALIEEKRNN